ncbi:MAG: TRAP transporter substrate-binding protein [Burkholderiaceae bacterium]|nr:TRAP transporter substrate-binding protein [Burkholderiaceae bacterium]
MFRFSLRPGHCLIKALAISVAALAASAASAQVVLKYSRWLPPPHAINTKVIEPWAAEVKRVTSGRVTVEFLPKAVATPAAQFDVIRDGLADFGVVLAGYTPGRFPVLDLGELPLISSDVAQLAPAFYRIYAKHLAPLDPFAGTHVLTIFSTTPNHILTRSSLVNKLDDMKGLKLRAPSESAVAIIKAVGSVAIQKPISEMYELASTGVVDGTFNARTAVSDWKLNKVLPYLTVVKGGIGQPTMAFLVNSKKWSSISAPDRDAIMAISGEKLAALAGKSYAEHELAADKNLKAQGMTIKDASPELMAELEQRLSVVGQAWVNTAKAAGLTNAEAVLAEFRAQANR